VPIRASRAAILPACPGQRISSPTSLTPASAGREFILEAYFVILNINFDYSKLCDDELVQYDKGRGGKVLIGIDFRR
jgi:hypothetical protein